MKDIRDKIAAIRAGKDLDKTQKIREDLEELNKKMGQMGGIGGKGSIKSGNMFPLQSKKSIDKQLQQPAFKGPKPIQAEMIKFDNKGQWSLKKEEAANYGPEFQVARPTDTGEKSSYKAYLDEAKRQAKRGNMEAAKIALNQAKTMRAAGETDTASPSTPEEDTTQTRMADPEEMKGVEAARAKMNLIRPRGAE
jgi:hypothetical protein